MENLEFSWSKVASFYKSLSEKDGWAHLKPFLGLINEFAESEYGGILYPYTSMHNLVIASVSDYPGRLHQPYVVIAPQESGVEVRLGPSLKDYDKRFFFSFEEAFKGSQPLLKSLVGYAPNWE